MSILTQVTPLQNLCVLENATFMICFSKISPTVGEGYPLPHPPPLGRFTPSPYRPIDSIEIFSYVTSYVRYTKTEFQCSENATFMICFSKIFLYTVGGGYPLPQPPPLGCFVPSPCPPPGPLKNPSYTSDSYTQSFSFLGKMSFYQFLYRRNTGEYTE